MTRIKWTNSQPSKTGHYWWRMPGKDWLTIHHITDEGSEAGELNCDTVDGDTIEEMGGQWAGPLIPPKEPKP